MAAVSLSLPPSIVQVVREEAEPCYVLSHLPDPAKQVLRTGGEDGLQGVDRWTGKTVE